MKRNGHKFNAKVTFIDGLRFASKAEAKRYGELKLMEKAGAITGLGVQPVFKLRVNGEVIGRYLADFDYWLQHGNGAATYVVEDVKSPATKTAIYNWKKKHMKAEHGITITEITR